MYKVSVLRAVQRLFFTLLMVSPAHVALAQPALDPTSIEFAPSLDHSALASDGTTPIVQEYLLNLYVVGQPAPFRTTTLGKPAAAADGKIRLDFMSLVSPFATPGVVYEAKVMASGPGGVAASLVSNQFSYSTVCAVTLSPGSLSVVAAGGSGSVALTTAAGCAWSATSSAGWLTTTSGASGSGSGTVGFTIAPNTGQSARVGSLMIGGQTFTVNQDGPATCAYTATLSSLPIYAYVEPFGAGSYVWQASTADVRAPQRGGPGRVMSAWFAEEFSIDLNIADAQPHQVALYMADYDDYGRAQRVDIVDGMGVVLDSRTVSAFTGGQYLVWTVQGHVTVRVTRLEGNNAVVSAVLIGPGTTGGGGIGAPSATFVKTDTTTQGDWKGVYGASGFVVVADATSPVLASAAGSGVVMVTAGHGCEWTSASNAAWLTSSNGAGSGSAMMGFNIAANTSGLSRDGTLTIGAQTLVMTQSAVSCAYALSAAGQPLPAAGGSGTLTVATSAGCAWTSTSNAPWLTVTSGAAATGPGDVAFSAPANTGSLPRSAALTIGGKVFTVTQPATPCAYAISATGQTFTSVAGSGSVAVTAGAGCAWTATSSSPTWLTVTSGASGSGGGTVSLSAAANPGSSSRTGTLSVAGLTFTVLQTAAPCAFVVSPLSVPSMLAAGATSAVAVTSATGCTWTATSSTAWLTMTPGTGGTGSGSATFSASSNTASTSRVGVMTVAGQTVTVTQAGVVTPCTIVLTPMVQSVNAKTSTGSIQVTTGAGCTWTARSSAAWLTISSAVNSQGKVTYDIAKNGTGANRTATVTVGSVTSTITQRTDGRPNPVSGLRVVGG